VVGRFLVGLGIGASAIVVPAYLAEIAPAAKRGAVVQTYEVRLPGIWDDAQIIMLTQQVSC
jgi:MFS family permease